MFIFLLFLFFFNFLIHNLERSCGSKGKVLIYENIISTELHRFETEPNYLFIFFLSTTSRRALNICQRFTLKFHSAAADSSTSDIEESERKDKKNFSRLTKLTKKKKKKQWENNNIRRALSLAGSIKRVNQ